MKQKKERKGMTMTIKATIIFNKNYSSELVIFNKF